MPKAALCQLGMLENETSAAQQGSISTADETSAADHFIVRNGVEFAGTHLIIDIFNGSNLDKKAMIENALKECVEECGATLLHIHLHIFTEGGGVSGVAVLAESHISIHTWPERQYAALDVFMCGDANPRKAVPILKRAFETANVRVSEHLRGEGA